MGRVDALTGNGLVRPVNRYMHVTAMVKGAMITSHG